MIAHYASVAIRNAKRKPLLTLMNIVTLALGLMCFVTASAVVGFWNRSESHFKNADRAYVVTTQVKYIDGSSDSGRLPTTNHYTAKYLKTDFPQLEAVARVAILNTQSAVSYEDRAIRVFGVAADPEFLDIFDLPFLAGDAHDALRRPYSVILTKEAAQRLYGTEQAVGKPILLGNLLECTVTGVIDDIAEPSHMGRTASAPLPFEMMTSRDVYETVVRNAIGRDTTQIPENWLGLFTTTYVLMPKDGSLNASSLSQQLAAFASRHVPTDQMKRANVTFGLIPIREILGMSGGSSAVVRESGLSIPAVVFLLGALVLVVACINYANLATARAVARAREVGLRKALGASAVQVMLQYVFEAGLLVIVALAIALAAVLIIAPVIHAASGIDLRLSLLSDSSSWWFLAALIAVVSILAGAYPAFVLSRVQPVLTLRMGKLKLGPRFLSTLLVGGQFAVASFLLFTVTIVYLQNAVLRSTGLDVSTDPLLVVENFSELTHVDQKTIRDQLLKVQQVRSETSINSPPWGAGTLRVMALNRGPAEGTGTERSAIQYSVGYDFFATLGIASLAGRMFVEGRDEPAPPDAAKDRSQNAVIDAALSRELGFSTPAQAIDETIYASATTSTTGAQVTRPVRIIGVVENRPLHILSSVGPTTSVYLLDPALTYHIVRVSKRDVAGALEAIDSMWKGLVPTFALNRRFVDEYFNESYQNFARISGALTGLAILALVISTIGLFAMALLMANRRSHEVGVRKVLGANKRNIVVLFLLDFSKPVIIGGAIGLIPAYLATRSYLTVFINPIRITPIPFVVCLIFIALIAVIAVGGQTWRASRLKPARVLAHE